MFLQTIILRQKRLNFKAPTCLLLIYTGLLLSINTRAQGEYQLKTFTADNGLTHNTVYSITQDKTGFLWLATWDGVSRFDGYEFRNYKHKPNDTATIPFFCADKVLTDRYNNVWVYTYGHSPVVYDRSNDSFRQPGLTSLLKSKPYDLVTDAVKNIWLLADSSVYQYNSEPDKLRKYRIVSDNNYSNFFAGFFPQLVVDNKGGIWIASLSNGCYSLFRGTFQPDSTILFHRMGDLNVKQNPSALIHHAAANFEIYVSTTGQLWILCKYGLFLLDKGQKRIIKYNSPVNPAEFKGKPYFFWTDDTSGINFIDTKRELHISLPPEKGNFFESLLIDNSGIIWAGDINQSRGNIGLHRYSATPDFFRHYLTDNNENNQVNIVFPIVKDKNNYLWAGTPHLDFLYRFSPSGTCDKVHYLKGPYGKSQPRVRSMAPDSGGIWMGTTGGQLIYYDFSTGKSEVQPLYQNEDDTPLKGIHNILKRGSAIIINGSEGVYRYESVTCSLSLCYRHEPASSGYAMVNDGNGGYWLGTDGNSVIHLDSRLEFTGEYKIGPENNLVEHICPGDSNDIWVALMGGGLGHLYPGTQKHEIFTTADGLSNNVIYSILKDRKGTLWLSTNQGLSSFNPQTRQFSNFGKNEGLLITEFNSDSFFQTPGGEMFFGGIGGLVGFYPDTIQNYSEEISGKSLILTDFRVSGIPRHFSKPIPEADTLILKNGEDNFQITFACLDLLNQQKIRYRYRLSGEENEWIETDFHHRTISFANLSHDNYLLELEATNESGEWANRKSVMIIIPHRFTELLWVRIPFIIILISGFIFAAIVNLRQRRQIERQINDQLRLESLRGQMNPHFIFNSLSSINYFISKEDKVSANNYIADFSRLIRSILSNLTTTYIPFEKEIESINDYLRLEHLRFGDKFNYSVRTDRIPEDTEIFIYPGMIQPFIENSVWHGVRGLEPGPGFINIDFTMLSPTKIQCIVEDDGIGRRLAALTGKTRFDHKSRGIDIVRERIRIFNNMTKNNYRVVIEDLYPDREESGTRVCIDLPATDKPEEKDTGYLH